MSLQVREALSAAGFGLSADVRSDTEPAHFVVVRGVSALQAFRVAEVVREAMELDVNARFTIHMKGAPSLAEFRRTHKAPRPSGKL